MLKIMTTFVAATLVSAVSLAAVIAKTQVVCVQDPEQQIIRTIYMADDNSIIMADPLGALMTADSVQQPSNDTVVITSAGVFGTEALSINNDGTGSLAVTTPSGNTSAIKMGCFSPNAKEGSVQIPAFLKR